MAAPREAPSRPGTAEQVYKRVDPWKTSRDRDSGLSFVFHFFSSMDLAPPSSSSSSSALTKPISPIASTSTMTLLSSSSELPPQATPPPPTMDVNEEMEVEEETVIFQLPPSILERYPNNSWREQELSWMGLDTDTPFLRIGNVVMQGEWRQLLGTHLLFSPEDPQRHAAEDKMRLRYEKQSQTVLRFRIVDLVPKHAAGMEPESPPFQQEAPMDVDIPGK